MQAYFGIFKFILKTWKRYGVLTTFKIAFYEIFFDIKYKTNTLQITPLEKLYDIKSKNKNFGTQSQASYVYLFQKAFKEFGRDNTKHTFLDFGCGKGRALLLAAKQGFKKVIGIDFSQELCDISEKNINKFQKKIKGRASFSVECADAATFIIPKEVDTIYFYHPFEKNIMEMVLKQIEISIKKYPRNILAVYCNEQYPELLKKFKYKEVFTYHYANSEKACTKFYKK